jgi:hypothetical protein
MNASKRSFEISPEIRSEVITSRARTRSGLILTFLGLLVFMIGARPALFGLDRSPVVGFVQIAVFLVGLAMICLGGYISLNTYWRNGDKTIVADIGLRLVSTGYVIAAFAGMADVFGFGGQPWPNVPFFGIWQATGVEIGQIMIAVGFLMMLPFRRNRRERMEE